MPKGKKKGGGKSKGNKLRGKTRRKQNGQIGKR